MIMRTITKHGSDCFDLIMCEILQGVSTPEEAANPEREFQALRSSNVRGSNSQDLSRHGGERLRLHVLDHLPQTSAPDREGVIARGD